jgi:hypothetical protein
MIALSIVIASTLLGCGSASDSELESSTITPVSVDGSKYVLADEPDGAIGVIEARKTAANGDPIVVVGRIGGAKDPWIEGRAAFMLLDASMMIVADGTESNDGEICMDECCATERAGSTTLVKIIDDGGKVLGVDARQLFGVNADDMVVVSGKASKDEMGNFVVLASGIHIRL